MDKGSASASRLAGVRVLVVEDDDDTREGMMEYLLLEGATVFGAPSSDAGWRVLVDERPDVVLSDICMPGGNGYDFVRRIRTLPSSEGGRTPTIAWTCLGDRAAALAAGFDLFVQKPFDLFILMDTIAALAKSP